MDDRVWHFCPDKFYQTFPEFEPATQKTWSEHLYELKYPRTLLGLVCVDYR